MRDPNGIVTRTISTRDQYIVEFGYNSRHMAQFDYPSIVIDYRGAKVTFVHKPKDSRTWIRVESPLFSN